MALELHLRILWLLSHQAAIPPVQVKSSVTASLDQNSGLIHDSCTLIEEFLKSSPDGRVISHNIKHMSQSNLLLMFRTVAILGLEQWAPDILSCDPDSMYNLLHEHIALITFEQVSSTFSYSHMGLDLSLLHDFPLMRKLYQSFIFNYMYNITKVEAKKPGSIAKGKLMSNVWKCRDEVSYDHLTFPFFVYTV